MRSNRNSSSLRSPSFRSGSLRRAQEEASESLVRASRSVLQEMHQDAAPADGRDRPSVFGLTGEISMHTGCDIDYQLGFIP